MKRYLVFYGFAKLTKKMVRKRSIAIYFANTHIMNDRQKAYINQKIHIVYQRWQNEEEAKSALGQIRCWTKWEYFVDDKKWKGDLERVLEDNFMADENNVSLEERTKIRELLRKGYYSFYGIEEPKIQKSLIFN